MVWDANACFPFSRLREREKSAQASAGTSR
jgi:hypothetical protein